jgi:hypothetical protein
MGPFGLLEMARSWLHKHLSPPRLHIGERPRPLARERGESAVFGARATERFRRPSRRPIRGRSRAGHRCRVAARGRARGIPARRGGRERRRGRIRIGARGGARHKCGTRQENGSAPRARDGGRAERHASDEASGEPSFGAHARSEDCAPHLRAQERAHARRSRPPPSASSVRAFTVAVGGRATSSSTPRSTPQSPPRVRLSPV